MKIITDTKAYVQLNDLAYLMKSSEGKAIPASVVNKVFGEMFICTDSNRYDFMEFDDPEEIKFFKNLEYSVDYLECINLTDAELVEKGEEVASRMNEVAKKFNSLDETEKGNHLYLVNEHELLQFKMYSIRDILWFRMGKLKMKLPKDAKDICASKKPESKFKKIVHIFKRR